MNVLLTPFGVPFDTAVLAGLVLTGITVALAGRRSAAEKRERTAAEGAESAEESQENRS
jgi:hypothetical protein